MNYTFLGHFWWMTNPGRSLYKLVGRLYSNMMSVFGQWNVRACVPSRVRRDCCLPAWRQSCRWLVWSDNLQITNVSPDTGHTEHRTCTGWYYISQDWTAPALLWRWWQRLHQFLCALLASALSRTNTCCSSLFPSGDVSDCFNYFIIRSRI